MYANLLFNDALFFVSYQRSGFRVSSFTCVLEASSQELFSLCFDGAFFFV